MARSTLLLILVCASGSPALRGADGAFFEHRSGRGFIGTTFGNWASFEEGHIRFDSGLTIEFLDASRTVALQGLDRSQAAVHFVQGSPAGRGGWSGITRPAYRGVRYVGLYPGVDLICRAAGRGWKSDFLLAPGTPVASIRMRYRGVGPVSVGANGQLKVLTANGELEERIPRVYQTLPNGAWADRPGVYRISPDGTVGFAVGGLDPSLPTTIDPALEYSSYWGGNRNDAITSVAFGSDDSIFIAGWTESANMTVAAAEQNSLRGATNGFVAKFSPNGQSLQWATFFGGSGADRINSLAVDSSGRAVVAGSTTSSNFPLQLPVQSLIRGSMDGFVARFAASGATLDFSTYFGGSGLDAVNAVVVDSTGIYLGGQTTSTDFPVLGALHSTALGGQDAFLVKLNPSGISTLYSTYLGGSGDDAITALAVYQQQPFVTGSTFSSNLEVVGGTGPRGGMDAFVMHLASSGASVLGSTYLGGSSGSAGQPETATAIQVTSAGEAVVAGITSSVNFPVSGATATTFGGGGLDGFVVKFASSLASTQWGRFLGGNGSDAIYGLALRKSGQIVAVGTTSSTDFPAAQSPQATYGGSSDAFVTVLLPTGASIYSTLWGGNGSDAALAVANGLANPNSVLVGGWTSSTNAPMINGYQTTPDTQFLNSFFAKFDVAGGTIPHGKDKLGYYRSGGFALDKNDNYVWDAGDIAFPYGIGGDIPVVGDWTGTGNYRVGVFRGGVWYVDIDGDRNWTWGVDAYYYYGIPGDIPLVGDWTGDGRSKLGVYRPSTGIFYLDWDGNNAWTNYLDKIISWGSAGDIPVVGDWTGSGTTKIGLFKTGQKSVVLNWADNVNPGGTSYNVYRSPNLCSGQSLVFTKIAPNVAVKTYTDSGVNPGNYCYQVSAALNGAESTGNPTATVSIAVPAANWLLDLDGDLVFTPGIDGQYSVGTTGDRPVPMNLNGIYTEPVVWRSTNGAWISKTGIFAFFGYPGDVPIVGPW